MNMNETQLRKLLDSDRVYDLNYLFENVDTSGGDKISIQGKSIDDAVELYMNLHKLLFKHTIPFKLGTQKRINHKDKIQSKKVMTIYIPNSMKLNDVCEMVYKATKKYKGWYDVPTPNGYKHYAGGLFTRNDRDNNGNYIAAKDV